MRVLIVGAGAVGQTYGWHLQKGGADVSFFVKEKYRAEAEAGFTIYPLNKSKRPAPEAFTGFGVYTDAEQFRGEAFDQIWITVSSPALRGDWLPALAEAAPDATLVSFSPGADDRDHVLKYVSSDRLVTGLIPFIAYQAPLIGETRFTQPGIAIWHPPFSSTPLTGPEAVVDTVVPTLKRGGIKANKDPAVHITSQFPTAYMMPHLVALELADWSFAGLRQSDWLLTANKASAQAAKLMADRAGVPVPSWGKLATPLALRWLTRFAPILIPMDIETYLEYHFTKVGDQTRMFIDNYLALAAETGADASAVAELKAGLAARDAKQVKTEPETGAPAKHAA